jgi:hypothetical protein
MLDRRLARWAPALLLFVLLGCTLETPAPPEPVNLQTARALTPQPTLTPPPPTSTPTATPIPATATPTPATATPADATSTTTSGEDSPDLVDVSYCRRQFGPVNGTRFRARLESVQTSQTDQFEQVTFVFTDTSGALHGDASCFSADAWPVDADIGASIAPGATVIAVDLFDWAHDDLFAASPLTETATISPSGVLEQVAFAADSLSSRGALLGVGLREPRPFRVRVEDSALIVEVAREAEFPPQDDPLGQAEGALPDPSAPLFFLHQGDVYRLANGQAQPVAQTPELEIGLAVSPDGQTLAVCRAPADAEPFALPYAVRATLWTIRADGSDPQQLADIGGCAEPAFASSGRTIAFTANTAASPPALLQVWTVPVVGGEVTPVTRDLDEWSRAQPQWLADGRLVYRATNDSGQSIIFVRESDGAEQELTAALLTGSAYRSVGSFVVNGESGQIAVEAIRSADEGADLVVLRANGTQVAAEKRGFWQRPLAFAGDDLWYLTAECPSQVVLSYTLHRRTAQGTIEDVVSGMSAAEIGTATVQGQALLYIRSEDVDSAAGASLRGPRLPAAAEGDSSIWGIAFDGAARAEIFAADQAIEGLTSAAP